MNNKELVMIKNDQQRTQAESRKERLERTLDEEDLSPEQAAVVQSQIARIEQEIDAYLEVRHHLRERFEIHDLMELADVLVLARIARGVTQAELANELGVQQQQVTRDENGGYCTARLSRLSDVLDALDYDVTATIRPADRTDIHQLWFDDDFGTAPTDEPFKIFDGIRHDISTDTSAERPSRWVGKRMMKA